MEKCSLRVVWQNLVFGFGIVALTLLAGHTLAYGVYGTSLFALLYPDANPLFDFGGRRGVPVPWLLEKFFEWTVWPKEWLEKEVFYFLLDRGWHDTYGLSRYILIGPFLEEVMHRGPLWLLRRHAKSWWWMALAVLGAALFALSHPAGFGNLIPVFGFAMVGSWLIRETGRFWPAFLIHAACNAHLTLWRISLGLQ